jgi:hypothetical protein
VPNDLDALYHEYTDFDAQGATALRFGECLGFARKVVERTLELSEKRRTKVKKLDLISLVAFFQGVRRNPDFKVSKDTIDKLAGALLDSAIHNVAGKSTSGRRILEYYDRWRSRLSPDIGIRLDPRREFANEQKQRIYERCGGLCQVCGAAVGDEDSEYDHFPVPYRDGGKTEVDNGRLVHGKCHPRGRPIAE